MKGSNLLPVEPFSGLYWRDKQWQKYVCPPYDVIPLGHEKHYQKLSPRNIIHLELPARIFLKNPYQRAGKLFQLWRRKGVFNQSASPSFYLVEETFFYEGKYYRRQGIFGLFNLAAPIFVHEKTLSAPKVDRKLCLENIRANTSAVFILVENKDVSGLVSGASGKLLSEFEFSGVKYKIKEISKPEIVSTWKKVLAESRFYVADGHHRLETAKNCGAKYVLSYFVPTDSPGLVILPTHRIVRFSPDLFARQQKYFYSCSLEKSLFSVYYQGKLDYLNLRKRYFKKKLPAEILREFLLQDISAEDIIYSHSEKESRKIADEKNYLAYLLPATPLKVVLEYSRQKKILPPKSTYFYPKIIAGLIIYAYAD